MPTPRSLLVSLALAALLALPAAVVPATAQSPVPTPVAPDTADAPDVPGRTQYAPTRVRAASPLASELRASEAAYSARERELRDRLAASSGEARLALMRELEQLRRARPARLAEVQLRHARRRGDAATVARLERRLALLRAAGVTLGAEGAAR